MTIRRGNTIVAGIASTVVLDNVTTNYNANDAVQSIGLINKNASGDTAVYNWVGTLAQYTSQQIATTHPDWICYITDDGESSISPWCLFDFKYTDYILSNPNWVNADANNWCTSTNYPNAYAHLVADQLGGTQETETIGSYTITFYRAVDGHKVCLADQAETIANIFTETGVAWYYLLDTENSRFKLPRELPFNGQTKGNGMALGLTNGTTNYGLLKQLSGNVGFLQGATGYYGVNVGDNVQVGTTATNGQALGVSTDPTKSGIILNRTTTKYLNFFVN